MKPPKGYIKTINELIKDWYSLANRSDVPILPVIYKIERISSKEFEKIYGVKVPLVSFWEKNVVEIYLDGRKYRQLYGVMTELLYNNAKIKNHSKKLEKYCQKAKIKASFFEKNNLSKLSTNRLKKHYQELIESHLNSFYYGFVSWCPEILHKQANEIIKKKCLEDKININPKDALNILIKSFKKNEYQKKDEFINGLIKKYSKKIVNIRQLNKKNIKLRLPDLDKEIKQFLDKYKWVGYDYNGPAISYDEIIKILLESEEEKNNQKLEISKKDLIKEAGFNKDEIYVFNMLAEVSHIKDLRNNCDDYVYFCLDIFFTELSRRFNIEISDIKYLWPNEIDELMEGKKFSKKYLREKKCFSLFFNHKIREYYSGQGLKVLKEVIQSKKSKDKFEEEMKEIKGSVACAGKIKGKVKIVYNHKTINKIKKGDVLVAYMTSPRFMPAILKCSAIITNDGGITSHAAIISRELKKPCIIGTKIATKVLKDGDLVEVDADQGIVKIIKK